MAGEVGSAPHECEQAGNRGHLPDPENERPLQHLEPGGRRLLADAGETVTERRADVGPERTQFLGKPSFEAIRSHAKHLFAPILSFRVQQFDQPERRVVLEPDAQGRVLIPQYLKEHAGLRFDVLVQGAGNRAEIWDTKRWAAYEKSTIAPAYKKIGKSLEI